MADLDIDDLSMPDAGGVDLDFDLEGFDVGELGIRPAIESERYQKPKVKQTEPAAFDKAIELAESIDLHEGMRAFCLLSGNVIFGDFIEAMTSLDKWRIDHMTIHTLTMSQDTIDSLANVIAMDEPSSLHIIMSDYWYAHERSKADGLLWELYDQLDIGDGFRLAFCRTHAKVVTIRTKAGHKLVIHGSANMRSHGVIEQFTIECDPDIYDFVERFNDGILDEYDTINADRKRKRAVSERKVFKQARRAEAW